jgi:heme-degrading monooxygenase HmoA
VAAVCAAAHAYGFAVSSTIPRSSGRDRLSFAPWESIDAMHAWKNSPEFPQHMGPVLAHVAEFTPQEMELVAQS